nr:hypothetical protein KK1_017020 [Cajanus cajan]
MGYLTGTSAAPPMTDPSYSNWDAENSIVMAWLINSMELKIGRTYLFCKTAHEIWTTVQEMYSDLQNSAQCFEIRSALRNTQQGNKSVTEYFNMLVELWQEMDLFYTVSWKCSEDKLLYDQMLEKERVFDFLQGLTKELDEVRGRILGLKPLPTLKEAFAMVRREESRRKVMLQNNPTIEDPHLNSALVSRKNDLKTIRPKEAKTWCDHCQKPYHTKETCWLIHGKPADWKPRSQ